MYRVEYLKPESNLVESTYSTKIIYYYAWSSGYYTMGSKSGNTYQAIANLLLAYTPTFSKLASWIVGQATGSFFGEVDQSRPITAESKNKYFYLNKTGAVYIAGVWLPRVYIGSRRSFAWSWTTYYTSYGEPRVKQNGPKDGIGMPPYNYDSNEKKNRYDDTTWILEEAARRAFSYAYVDVFVQSGTQLP